MFLNHSQKYVISAAPADAGKLEWGPVELLKGELASALAYVKGKPGKNIQVPGSPKLVRSLLQHRLLDELNLTICPEIVGAGLRLFDEATGQLTLTLERARVHSNGAISVTYRPSSSSDGATAAPLSFPDAAAGRK
jgi:dihydrofolate reductase